MTFLGLKCSDLSLVLTHAHSGFYDVYHIVAEFLAFLYDIHVHRAYGVGVEVVVHVVDVLALQLVSVVVDFVLYVEREIGIVVYLMSYERDVHLCERLVGKLHHLVHVLIL